MKHEQEPWFAALDDLPVYAVCPRCGGDTTEQELTYSGCAACQRERASEDGNEQEPSS